jgi:hypothetical protein
MVERAKINTANTHINARSLPWLGTDISIKSYRINPDFLREKNLNGIGDGNNKNQTRHVFKYKHTKWSRWCITASLNYEN